VDAEQGVRRALTTRPDLRSPDSRTLVVAAGKAAAGMLRAFPVAPNAIALLPAGADASGVPSHASVLRGGHPYPTTEGCAATRRILSEASALGAGDRLLVLLSGGASALLEAPTDGIALDDLIASHRALALSGLAVASINLVRGCLSAVKAGGLAAAASPAMTTTLAISDVEHDDPAVIGSGPTVPAALALPERCRRALELVSGARVALPSSVLRFLEEHARTDEPPPDRHGELDYTVIASVADAVRAAQDELARRGYRLVSRGAERLSGDTAGAADRVLGIIGMAGRAAATDRATAATRAPLQHAAVLGGETTVAVTSRDPGRGGRSLDLAARVALAIRGQDGVAVVCAGTDGVDGSSRAAGAVVDGASAERAEALGFPLHEAIAAFHTEPALEAAGDLVVTGPTGTNVGDLVVVVSSALRLLSTS
jgi:glycerate-2-kinase